MKLKHFVYFLSTLMISCSSNDTMEEEEMAMVKEKMTVEEEEEISSNLMGEFMNGAHPTSGSATVNEDMTELVLTNFKTDAGPFLELYIYRYQCN